MSLAFQRTATGPAIVQAVQRRPTAPTYTQGRAQSGDTGMTNPDGPVFMGLTRTQLMIGGGLALVVGAAILAQR